MSGSAPGGPSITVAATASGQINARGGVLAVAPDQVTDWLGPLPVDALHGIGPGQAAALHDYGIHRIGRTWHGDADSLSEAH
ncbi:hypothetical protein [Streptomyces cacaoi]|uniref:hypothetical protein n=1 Tax=Streptomyces cacaoi TaxID=1898 RepID=UPI003749DCEE